MKSIDEIFQDAFDNNNWPEETLHEFKTNDEPLYEVMKEAIKTAQREAIEECAEVSKPATAAVLERKAGANHIYLSILQLKNQIK